MANEQDKGSGAGLLPRKRRLDVLAKELGYTPQFVPGPAGRFRANGLAENSKYADFAAAKARHRWSDDTQVTKEEIEQAIAAVACVEVR